MEEQKFSFSGTFQKTKEYIDTQVELIRLKVIAKSARILASLIVDMSKLLLVLAVVFFFSMALGFYLGELLGSYALGFLSTGGIFLLILFVTMAIEPKLEARFMDITIRKVLGKWNEEDEHLSSIFEKEEQDTKVKGEGEDERKDQ